MPSPVTRGSTSGPSRSSPSSPTAPADWTISAGDGSLPLGGSESARWRLLALSGGRPVSLFGMLNGERLTPLAAGDGFRTVGL